MSGFPSIKCCIAPVVLLVLAVVLGYPVGSQAEGKAVPPPVNTQAPADTGSSESETGLLEEGSLTEEPVEVQEIKNVTISGDRISVEFRDIPLADALNEIGAMANFGVVTDDQVKSTPVSVKFKDQLLEKGLMRIIRLAKAGNFRYYYRDDGTLETVVAVGAGAAIPTQAEASSKASQGRSSSRHATSPSGSRATSTARRPASSRTISPTMPTTSPQGGIPSSAMQPNQVVRPSVPSPPSARMRTPIPVAPPVEESGTEDPDQKQ